jgi:hypothetical protein
MRRQTRVMDDGYEKAFQGALIHRRRGVAIKHSLRVCWTIGIFTAASLLGSLSASAAGAHREPGHAAIIALLALIGGGFLVLFTGLIISAIHGSRAAHLRKKLGIPWPPPG